MAKCGYIAATTQSYQLNSAAAVTLSATGINGTAPSMVANLSSAPSGLTIATTNQRFFAYGTTATLNSGDFPITAVTSQTQFTYSNPAGTTQATTTGTFAIGAAQTLLTVQANAAYGIDLKKVQFSFSGVQSTVTPFLVEIVSFAAAPGGTGIAITPQQVYGRTNGTSATVAGPYSTEPTNTATIVDSWYVTPNSPTVIYDWPLGTSIDTPLSGSLGLRITPSSPALGTNVNARASMLFERA